MTCDSWHPMGLRHPVVSFLLVISYSEVPTVKDYRAVADNICRKELVEKIGAIASMSLLQCVAVCCSVLQCVAVCCSVLQCLALCPCCGTAKSTARRESELFHTLQHTATHCNTLQHATALREGNQSLFTHCNTLQHPAAHCNTLQHTATPCNTLQHCAKEIRAFSHTATHCNTLQHITTHYNTLQHPAIRYSTARRESEPGVLSMRKVRNRAFRFRKLLLCI